MLFLIFGFWVGVFAFTFLLQCLVCKIPQNVKDTVSKHISNFWGNYVFRKHTAAIMLLAFLASPIALYLNLQDAALALLAFAGAIFCAFAWGFLLLL